MPKSSQWKSLACLVFGLATVAGCGGGTSKKDPVGRSSSALSCQRDETLLAQRSDCRSDDHCPCGASCQNGLCIAGCKSASECGSGESCDNFGRCVTPGQPSLPAQTAPGKLTLGSALIDVVDVASPRRLTVSFVGGAPRSVRISAEVGVQVQCGGGDFVADCTLAAAATSEIGVRLDGSVPVGAGRSLRFFADPDVASVSVRRASGSTPVAAAPTAGRYDGLLRLVPPASPNAPAATGSPLDAIGGVGVPVRASIFVAANGFVGTLSGPGFFPEAPFAIAADGMGSYTVTVAPTRFAGSFGGLGEGGAVVSAQAVKARFDGATLDAALALTIDGPTAPGSLPTSWRLVLSKTGELDPSTTAPTIPAAEVVTSLASRLAAESDWVTKLRVLAQATANSLTTAASEALVYPTLSETSLLGCYADIRSIGQKSSRRICVDHTLGTDQLIDLKLTALCDLPSNTIPADGIPCASVVDTGFRDHNNVFQSATGVQPSADHCPELATNIGCQIVDAAPTEPVFEQLYRDPATGFLATNLYRVSKYCQLTSIKAPASRCAQLTACGRGGVNLESTQLAAQVSSASGELACQDGQAQGIFPLFEADASTAPTGADLIRLCGDELDRTSSDQLTEIFGSASCIDRGRFEVALEQSLSVDRRRAVDPTVAADPAASAFGHRLLQRWLDLHGVIAREGLEAMRLEDSIGSSDLTDATVAALRRSLSGWQLILHARQSSALLALPVEVLRNPDPRPRLRPDAVLPHDRDDTHNVGLPVAILATLTAQLEGVDFLVERGWFSGTPEQGYDLARETLRHAVVGLALAGELGRRAQAGGAMLPWQRDLDLASTDFVLVYRRLVDRLGLIAQGKNPLGIDDADLPLYFSGDLSDPSRRFSAISDYLIGQGTGSAAWLPQAIESAKTALAAAVTDWSYRVDKQLSSQRRLDDITRRYGELITGYCGAPINDPSFNVNSFNVLNQPLDTETCFIEPSCRKKPEDFVGRLTVATLGQQLCVASRLRDAYGNSFSYGDARLDAAVTTLAPLFTAANLAASGGTFPIRIVDVQAAINERTVTVSSGTGTAATKVVVPLNTVGLLDAHAPAGFNPKLVADFQAACADARDKTEAARTATSPSSCRFADDCARGQICGEGSCRADATDDRLDRVDCYFDGAIAEQALAVRSAVKDVEIARAEADEFVDRYQIAMKSCSIFQQSDADIQKWNDDLNDTMTTLSIAKVSVDAVAHVAETQKEALSADDILVGGAAAVPGVIQSAAEIASDTLAQQMDEAQRKHDAQVAKRQMQADEAACVNDASMELVGAKAAALRITKSMQDLARNIVNLRGQKSYTAALWQEGRMALDHERELVARSTTQQFWLSEKVVTYQTSLRQARRVAYLAVRAVEYEYQASLLARQRVIAARHPIDLEAVMTELTSATGTRTVGGSRPSSLSTVVSLRSQLLQLRDKSQDPAGWQLLSDAERFRLYIAAPRFAVYDDGGVYQGQRVPFSLVPFGTEGLGQTAGIPLLAGSDCAERLWSVNASILGDDVAGANAGTSSRIELWKSNTFYSQWCSDSAGGPRYQVESVRPKINLFQEPGALPTGGQSNMGRGASQYSRARIQAYHNVSRAKFEAGEYGQGSTSELAARGLWGDYALFFPAATLTGTGGSQTDGLDLTRVDDILLRLDYVSVARGIR